MVLWGTTWWRKASGRVSGCAQSKSMVHAGTGRWRQKNGRPMVIVGSRPAVYRMAVLLVRVGMSRKKLKFVPILWGVVTKYIFGKLRHS